MKHVARIITDINMAKKQNSPWSNTLEICDLIYRRKIQNEVYTAASNVLRITSVVEFHILRAILN